MTNTPPPKYAAHHPTCDLRVHEGDKDYYACSCGIDTHEAPWGNLTPQGELKVIRHVDDRLRQDLKEHITQLQKEVISGNVAGINSVVFLKDKSSFSLGTCVNRTEQIAALNTMLFDLLNVRQQND